MVGSLALVDRCRGSWRNCPAYPPGGSTLSQWLSPIYLPTEQELKFVPDADDDAYFFKFSLCSQENQDTNKQALNAKISSVKHSTVGQGWAAAWLDLTEWPKLGTERWNCLRSEIHIQTSGSRRLILNDDIKAIRLYSILFPTRISGTNCFLLAYARSLSLDPGAAGVT